MQVAYSAGMIHTPRGSPRCSPMMMRRGHSPNFTPRSSPTTTPRSSFLTPKHSLTENWKSGINGGHVHEETFLVEGSQEEVDQIPMRKTDSNLKKFIPGMPLSVAIACLICNIIFPGLGRYLLFLFNSILLHQHFHQAISFCLLLPVTCAHGICLACA